MLKFPLLLLFALAGYLPLTAQSPDRTLADLGLADLSPAGRDTLWYHFTQVNPELFLGSTRLIDPLTLEEEAAHLRAYFTGRLSAEDLAVIDRAWIRKEIAFRQRTLVRGRAYASALACQRAGIDSLRALYHPRLAAFAERIEGVLSAADIWILQEQYQNSVAQLHRKRDDFLAHEARFTRPVTPAIYDYLAHGFAVMEEIPASYYYDLLGTRNGRLPFLNHPDLAAYYAEYAAFETALVALLETSGCRAHRAIPFFQVGDEYAGRHRRRNALFYAVRHLLEPATPDAEQAVTAQRVQDTLDRKTLVPLTGDIAELVHPDSLAARNLRAYQRDGSQAIAYTRGATPLEGLVLLTYDAEKALSAQVAQLNAHIRTGKLQRLSCATATVYAYAPDGGGDSREGVVVAGNRLLHLYLIGEELADAVLCDLANVLRSR